MVLLATKQVCGISGALVKDKTFIISTLNILLKDNLLNVPQLGITETVRGIHLIIFRQKLIKFGILISTRPCVQTWVN
jgi:hypothetical protein